jgi:DNA polymerase V
MSEPRKYIAIDLKSFYASVECVDRELNPLSTNLVVADRSRTEKTICLAVSPSLKKYGIPGRARLFEVVQRVREVNVERCRIAPACRFSGKSVSDDELNLHPDYAVDYIVAPPRMARYVEVSRQIYGIYLRFIAPEDIHIYSVDEVFMDVTSYLKSYKMTAHELAIKIIREVLTETGITATAGIGTNMYLCKIAMDIVAKKMPADDDGVRIAELDEISYRRLLWNHQPLSDFWRFGRGVTRRLASCGIVTMGQLARLSLTNEDLLYKLFGVNAELIIDHAWGYEPCTIDLVKAYRPETNSLCSGQVLSSAYSPGKARVVVQEMADNLALDLVSKRLVTNQLVLTIGYDTECFKDPAIRASYNGEIIADHYGRPVPKYSHGTINLQEHTSSSKTIFEAVTSLFDRLINNKLLVRRLTITSNHVVKEEYVKKRYHVIQPDLFDDYEECVRRQRQEFDNRKKERNMQEALLSIKKKFGKNSVLKGLNYAEGATAKERNGQIGGHKA